jgi:hypothetical protein
VLKLKNPATDRQYRVLQNQSMTASQKLASCGVLQSFHCFDVHQHASLFNNCAPGIWRFLLSHQNLMLFVNASIKHEKGSGRVDADLFPPFGFCFKRHHPVNQSKQGIVFATTDIVAGMECGTTLTHQD